MRKSGKFLRYRGKQKPSLLVLSSVPFGYRLHTGVEFCLFVPRHTRASSRIDVTLHTFFVYASVEHWLGEKPDMAKKSVQYREHYLTPKAQVFQLQTESVILDLSAIGGSEGIKDGGDMSMMPLDFDMNSFLIL